MAESKVEVRLVRCPKCENLLPEPKDCSFFRCGGCGTILCAKNKNREGDSVSGSNTNNRVKETEEESDSDLENVHSDHDDPCLRPNVQDSDNIDSQSGSDRFRRRSDSEDFFRFSGSNYFSDSLSSDEAIKKDRAGLVRKLDNLKEQLLLLQPKDQQPRFEKAAQSRFFSSRRNVTSPSYYHHHYQEPDVSLHGLMQNPAYRAHPHYSRQYICGSGHDLFDTHQRNGMFHQSTCSCYRYDPYCRASGSVIPPSGLPDALYNKTGFGPLHSPRTFIPPPGSQTNAFSRSRVRCPKAKSRLIRSLAGGAPFITCKNCSKLLKLPEETDTVTRKKQSIRCGSCSVTIEFSFLGNKKLVLLSTDVSSARKAETRRSKLYYDFDSIDKELEDDISDDPVSTISEKAQEMQITDPTSPSLPEDELSSDSPSFRKLTPDSPRSRFEARNRSTRSEQDRVLTLSKRQNSMREASVAIEMDELFNESEVSQDSANDENRDDQVRRIKKNGFTSIVKNSFKDLKKSIQSSSSDVSVNGNHIPERLVKLAEKQAGPIRPGNYWYDYRAGFWGVMGGHCLGILPPFIEELNYPMPEKCANGNTRVFINGRELHQKDLRLLAARGLPNDKDRSYTVYISGRVIDEETGEELNSLGKLAPTVDKLKRGFGMRVPRRAA